MKFEAIDEKEAARLNKVVDQLFEIIIQSKLTYGQAFAIAESFFSTILADGLMKEEFDEKSLKDILPHLMKKVLERTKNGG